MKRKNTSHKTGTARNGDGISIAASAVKAQIAVFLSGALFLLLFCSAANASEDPDSILTPLSLCALFLSSFCGGFASVRLSGDGVLSGIAAGAVTSAVIFLLSLLPFAQAESNNINIPLAYLCIVASSAAGSVIGKRRTTNKYRPRKK